MRSHDFNDVVQRQAAELMASTMYTAWINAYEEQCGGPHATLGRCEDAVRRMVEEFPELRIIKGHAVCPAPWGRRGHWWCVDTTGNIIDPTRGQFTSGVIHYEEYQDGDDIRLGKCMECGEEIWGPVSRGHQTFCRDRCAQSFAHNLM